MVWHTGMPQPEVANHDVSSGARGLDRRSDAHTPLFDFFQDRWDDPSDDGRWVRLDVVGSASDLLVFERRVRVRPEPELGGSILDIKVAQRDICDEIIRVERVVEAAVLVDWLTLTTRASEGVVGCQPVPHGTMAEIATESDDGATRVEDLRVCQLQNKRVEVDMFAQVIGVDDGRSLQNVCYLLASLFVFCSSTYI